MAENEVGKGQREDRHPSSNKGVATRPKTTVPRAAIMVDDDWGQ